MGNSVKTGIGLALLTASVTGNATAVEEQAPAVAGAKAVMTTPVSLVRQSPSPVERTAFQQASTYPDDYSFTVYRKGKKIGRHDVEFSREGDSLKVYNDLKLRVKLLFITAYKLDYESTEIWKNGELVSLSSDINNNGKKLYMGGGLAGDTFGWETIKEERNSLPQGGEYFPTNHWYSKVVEKTQLLNTLTGNLIDVAITSEGFETIETESGPLTAERFQYSGALDSVVWYDEYGRWVGLEFKGGDGSTIRYSCNECTSWSPVTETSATAR